MLGLPPTVTNLQLHLRRLIALTQHREHFREVESKISHVQKLKLNWNVSTMKDIDEQAQRAPTSWPFTFCILQVTITFREQFSLQILCCSFESSEFCLYTVNVLWFLYKKRSCLLARARANNNRYCYVDVPISIDIRTNMLVLIDSDFTHEGVPIRIVIRTNVYVGISSHVVIRKALPINIYIRTNFRTNLSLIVASFGPFSKGHARPLSYSGT